MKPSLLKRTQTFSLLEIRAEARVWFLTRLQGLVTLDGLKNVMGKRAGALCKEAVGSLILDALIHALCGARNGPRSSPLHLQLRILGSRTDSVNLPAYCCHSKQAGAKQRRQGSARNSISHHCPERSPSNKAVYTSFLKDHLFIPFGTHGCSK